MIFVSPKQTSFILTLKQNSTISFCSTDSLTDYAFSASHHTQLSAKVYSSPFCLLVYWMFWCCIARHGLIFEANWSEIFFSMPEHGRGSRKMVSRSLLTC